MERIRPTHPRPHTHGINVEGSKTDDSTAPIFIDERYWPWILRAVPPPLGYQWTRRYFKRAASKAKITDLRLHDLRHLTAQFLVNAGRPLTAVQHTLRHSSSDMTEIYAKQRDKGENAKTLADVFDHAFAQSA